MDNAQKFYINGAWVEPSTTDTIDVINPATEKPIASIAMGGAADVDAAVAAAKAAFETFSQSSVEERIALLDKITELIGARSEGLSTMVHPVAIAGATLQAIWLSGQFQGVIIPTTPAGSLTSRKFSCCSSNS